MSVPPVLASAVVAAITTLALLSVLRTLAPRVGLVDAPGMRKTHRGHVPLVGGLAMFCGFATAMLTLDHGLTPYRGLVAAAALLVVVGVLDDLHELTSGARFGAQIGAAVMMIYWGGIELAELGALHPDGSMVDVGHGAALLTVFAAVGVVNAVNMCDGADGLAGGLVLVAVTGLAWAAHRAGQMPDRDVLLLAGVVVAVFLSFNLRLPGRPRALVFMGDAGSMFLGFLLAWFVIRLSQGPLRAMPPVTALWFLLVPLYDTVWLILRRASTGRSPMEADFQHLHHALQMAGMAPGRAVALIWALAVAGAAVGALCEAAGVAENTQFYAFLGLFALYCAAMAWSWHRARRLGLSPLARPVALDVPAGEDRRRAGDFGADVERRRVGDRRRAERRAD